MSKFSKWAGDWAAGSENDPAAALGDLGDFVDAILEAVGATSGDILESYDPLLDRVEEVVGQTIGALVEYLTPEQLAHFNDDYNRQLVKPEARHAG